MKRLQRFLVALAGAALLVGVTATSADAVEPHQHVVNTPGGSHDIAHGFCNGDFSSTQTQNVALANFHFKIHIGPQGPEGLVTITAHGC